MSKSNIHINNKFLNFIINDKFSRHRRFTLFVIIILLAWFWLFGSLNSAGKIDLSTVLIFNLGLLLAICGPILLNLFILTPKLLLKERYILFLFSVLFSICVFYGILTFCICYTFPVLNADPKETSLPDEALIGGGFFYLFVMCILCAATSAVKLFQKWVKDRYKIMELENNLISTELNLLKVNISPHFLFNMLNNTEVLIQTDPFKARKVLLKLSEFLRYQLYDSSRDKVLLSADINFLRNFLSLEKVRRDSFEFEIIEYGTGKQIEISPFLFIPFVENAVKYSVISEGEPTVTIKFILKENELHFTCHNFYDTESIAQQNDGGFGLPNIKRRLELLYPEKHEMVITQDGEIFGISLLLIL